MPRTYRGSAALSPAARITAEIVARLEAGTRPWVQPWRGAPVSRDRLSEVALGRPWRADRSVDQLVFNLRHKLPRDEHGVMLIQSIRTAGYWLRAPELVSDPVPGAERGAHRRPEAPSTQASMLMLA